MWNLIISKTIDELLEFISKGNPKREIMAAGKIVNELRRFEKINNGVAMFGKSWVMNYLVLIGI